MNANNNANNRWKKHEETINSKRKNIIRNDSCQRPRSWKSKFLPHRPSLSLISPSPIPGQGFLIWIWDNPGLAQNAELDGIGGWQQESVSSLWRKTSKEKKDIELRRGRWGCRCHHGPFDPSNSSTFQLHFAALPQLSPRCNASHASHALPLTHLCASLHIVASLLSKHTLPVFETCLALDAMQQRCNTM